MEVPLYRLSRFERATDTIVAYTPDSASATSENAYIPLYPSIAPAAHLWPVHKGQSPYEFSSPLFLSGEVFFPFLIPLLLAAGNASDGAQTAFNFVSELAHLGHP